MEKDSKTIMEIRSERKNKISFGKWGALSPMNLPKSNITSESELGP